MKGLSGFAFTLAISSRTSGESGTVCARPFFVLLPGMFQVAPSSLSSRRVMPATSFRLSARQQQHPPDDVAFLISVSRVMDFRCRLSLLKSRDFCGFLHGTFLGALDVLNDLARQLLAQSSEHPNTFTSFRRPYA
jgi:hypothetical protein